MSDAESGHGRRVPAVLAMVTTVAIAVVAGLQADADIRADVANRHSQAYAVQTAGELFRQGLRSEFELGTAADSVKDALEATVLELTALEQEAAGDLAGADALRERATLAWARADRLRTLTILFTDPAYAPQSPEAQPDGGRYLEDLFRESRRLLELQNRAADDYGRWNRRSDTYVAILALMAMALFLFGLAQAASARIRIPFSILGGVVLALGLVWTILVLVS